MDTQRSGFYILGKQSAGSKPSRGHAGALESYKSCSSCLRYPLLRAIFSQKNFKLHPVSANKTIRVVQTRPASLFFFLFLCFLIDCLFLPLSLNPKTFSTTKGTKLHEKLIFHPLTIRVVQTRPSFLFSCPFVCFVVDCLFLPLSLNPKIFLTTKDTKLHEIFHPPSSLFSFPFLCFVVDYLSFPSNNK